MYPYVVLLAAVVLLFSILTMRAEDRQRVSRYLERRHTDLVVVVFGKKQRKELAGDIYTIGRRYRHCDIPLGDRDQKLSRVHAILWYENGQYHIRPCRTKNPVVLWKRRYQKWRKTDPREEFHRVSVTLRYRLIGRFSGMDGMIRTYRRNRRFRDKLYRRIDRLVTQLTGGRRISNPQLYTESQSIPACGTVLYAGQVVNLTDNIYLYLENTNGKETL